eukprot:gene6933-11096_t
MFQYLLGGSKKDPQEIDDVILTQKQKYQVVLQKILSLEKYSKEELKDLQQLAKIISEKKLLKETYLNTKDLSEKMSYSVSGGETIQIEVENKIEKKLKIKLIITETLQNLSDNLGRQIISPVLNMLNISPWYFEWNDSGLCIPRKCSSKVALFTVDIGLLNSIEKTDTTLDIISNVIVKWNTTKGYDRTPKDKKVYGNCQHFIEDLLLKLNIIPKFEGPLGLFIEKMKTKGVSELIFETQNKEFEKKFEIKKFTKFQTHKQLDEFVLKLISKDMDFDIQYKSEYELLKGFDRAFWLRHYAKNENEIYQPLDLKFNEDEGKHESLCPFSDPSETGSIFFEKKK